MLAIVIAATAVVAVPLAARADNSDGDIAETKAVEMPEGAGELIHGEGFIPEGETRNVSPQPTEGEEKMNYTADTIPAVTGLTRQGESKDSILLSWDGIAGVKGYRVYRCDKAKGGDKLERLIGSYLYALWPRASRPFRRLPQRARVRRRRAYSGCYYEAEGEAELRASNSRTDRSITANAE